MMSLAFSALFIAFSAEMTGEKFDWTVNEPDA